MHADALIGLGEVDLLNGRYQETSSHFEQALAAGRQRRDLEEQAASLAALGRTENWRGRPINAVEPLCQALRLAEQLGTTSSQAGCLNDLGETLRLAGHHRRAAGAHQSALRHAETVGNAYQLARAHAGIADAVHATDPAGGRQLAQTANDLIDRLNLPDVQRLYAPGLRQGTAPDCEATSLG